MMLNGLMMQVDHDGLEIYINAMEVISAMPAAEDTKVRFTDGSELIVHEALAEFVKRLSRAQSRMVPSRD